jgi:hypothetical protein
LKRPTTIPALLVDSNHVTTCDIVKAQIFNKYFSSVFTLDNGQLPVTEDKYVTEVNSVVFTETTVKNALSKLSNTYSSGPDGFPSVFVSKLKDCIAEPLSTLFNVIFESGTLPQIWLCADVIPVFKYKGSSADVKNYRPISLTSVFSKVMEYCVKEEMLNHLVRNGLINVSQHGFLPKKSTLSSLILSINEWTTLLEEGRYVDVVYFDVQKAFDSVVHSKLLAKCASYGFGGNLLRFLEAFLSNRKQRVIVNGCTSDWSPVISGVPQGSVLGPLLFLIYINDFPSQIKWSTSFCYADDTKLSNSFEKREGYSINLQEDIDNYSRWTTCWQLKLHPEKCKVLPIGGRRNLRGEVIYYLNNQGLDTVSLQKDLGVYISSDLRFSQHCDKICGKASQKAGLILRAFNCRDKRFMTKMYTSRIRPILEYNSELWSPIYIRDIDNIEVVQRRFTKQIEGLQNLTYCERLQACELELLELRRLKRDLIFVYKVIHGIVDLSFDQLFSYAPNVGTRGHSYKLYPRKVRTNRAKNIFSNRIITIWNNLPSHVPDAQSLSIFRKELNKITTFLCSHVKGRAFRFTATH